MTADELGAALGAEFTRLGAREGIDGVLQSHGVTGVLELDASKYAIVLAQVQALVAPA